MKPKIRIFTEDKLYTLYCDNYGKSGTFQLPSGCRIDLTVINMCNTANVTANHYNASGELVLHQFMQLDINGVLPEIIRYEECSQQFT